MVIGQSLQEGPRGRLGGRIGPEGTDQGGGQVEKRVSLVLPAQNQTGPADREASRAGVGLTDKRTGGAAFSPTSVQGQRPLLLLSLH